VHPRPRRHVSTPARTHARMCTPTLAPARCRHESARTSAYAVVRSCSRTSACRCSGPKISMRCKPSLCLPPKQNCLHPQTLLGPARLRCPPTYQHPVAHLPFCSLQRNLGIAAAALHRYAQNSTALHQARAHTCGGCVWPEGHDWAACRMLWRHFCPHANSSCIADTAPSGIARRI